MLPPPSLPPSLPATINRITKTLSKLRTSLSQHQKTTRSHDRSGLPDHHVLDLSQKLTKLEIEWSVEFRSTDPRRIERFGKKVDALQEEIEKLSKGKTGKERGSGWDEKRSRMAQYESERDAEMRGRHGARGSGGWKTWLSGYCLYS
ncbi:uncharacterized protein LY89DRAFT_751649 [Mollisia scopiformis]|uniref:Uncharacterized protein n=1 Tax=Mollisia scopiformis TaxID=149040 RepID=A0A194X495_MOLSC|nr:uncharacterized protein LY89DRAFT_751649 [Mollisia scopiformis]KUJ15000.1 hypothetical protein LY89DRAFT_751649 [Mollisia scopiformis]